MFLPRRYANAHAILITDELGNALKSGQLQLTSTPSLRPPVPWRETQLVSTCTDRLTITEDQLFPTQAAVVAIDGDTTRQGTEARPSIRDPRQQELESVDPVEYSHTASVVPEPDCVSHPPASEATAQSARTKPKDSGVGNRTPPAARIDAAEPNPEADMANQEELNREQVQNLLEHLALLAAENPRGWTVAGAIAHIASIPSCTGCVEEFSAQVTNRKALRLLTEEYLVNTMGMNFGMALKVCDVIRSLIPAVDHATT